MARLDFFFDFASTYSHLAAQRIGALAEARGVEVVWRPMMLGPIFAAQGWTTSPFNLFPAKGANMWRDMERLAAKHGLGPVVRPDPFPQNGLLAARAAVAAGKLGPKFAAAVFQAEFAEGRDISEAETLAPILLSLGADPQAVLEAARSPGIKAATRANGEAAVAAGVFGAPSFVTEDRELFWGHDRLEDALDWTSGRARRP